MSNEESAKDLSPKKETSELKARSGGTPNIYEGLRGAFRLAAKDALPSRMREVAVLKAEGRENHQIAKLMRISKETVKLQLHKARQALGLAPEIPLNKEALNKPIHSEAADSTFIGAWNVLSPKRLEIAVFLARGWTREEIITQTNIDEKTLRVHKHHIRKMLRIELKKPIDFEALNRHITIEELEAARTPGSDTEKSKRPDAIKMRARIAIKSQTKH